MYDTLNRLTTIQAGSANHVYAYTGVNPLVQSLTRPNGSVTTYQYNGVNQLTEILNKTSTNDVLNQHVFTYNTLDLRGSETISGSALPAIPSLPEETIDYEYNAVNQLLSVTNPNLTFVYDDDGNMIQGYTPDGYVFTADYDAEDRMTSLEYTDSGSIVHRTEYQYSGDGFLAVIRKFENSSLIDEIRIIRDGFLAIQERDENNTVLREYTWGLNLGGGIGGLLALSQGGSQYSYLYDGKGNVAAVLDGSQAVVAAYRYSPFGKLLAKTGSLTQPFGFSTKRYDAQTGLLHYQYRSYAPDIGRWTTRDPLSEAGGLNLYAFVGNNPVNWVDPWGLFRSPDWMRALIPGQIMWDAAVTSFENGDYVGAVGHTLNMLTYQTLFVATLGQSPTVQQGVSTSIAGIEAAGSTIAGWCQNIHDKWIRFDRIGRWGKNRSESGPHIHFDPIPGSDELMKHHLPSQFRAWRGNLWSIIKRWWGGRK